MGGSSSSQSKEPLLGHSKNRGDDDDDCAGYGCALMIFLWVLWVITIMACAGILFGLMVEFGEAVCLFPGQKDRGTCNWSTLIPQVREYDSVHMSSCNGMLKLVRVINETFLVLAVVFQGMCGWRIPFFQGIFILTVAGTNACNDATQAMIDAHWDLEQVQRVAWIVTLSPIILFVCGILVIILSCCGVGDLCAYREKKKKKKEEREKN